MKLVIIINEPFPFGLAGANRILSYSKSIADLGHIVKVICLRPTEVENEQIVNFESKGVYNGVLYEYSSGTTLWPKSGDKKARKLLLALKGYINSVRIIWHEIKVGKLDGVLLYSNSLFNILFFFFVSKILNLAYLQEKSEYPPPLKNHSFLGKIYAYLYVNLVYKLFDGMIIETNTLIDYFKTKVRKQTIICRVPMTVEPDRFTNYKSITSKTEKYIAYCGNMMEPDGIKELIDAFQIISEKFLDIKLFLLGSPSSNRLLSDYKKQVSKYNLENRIIFKGKVSRDEVPEYLCNAIILALASPISLRSQGSLPSKLGEYLATGNPVVITNVGEIPNYLNDGVSAYLAVPGNVNSFAEKLDFVLSNPEKAHKVGQKGKEVMLAYFNCDIQAQIIVDFIYSLSKCAKVN